jgi:hypothetical protein
MVNVLEQAGGCSVVRRSEGKNRFFGNLWSTLAHTRLKTPWGNWTIFGQHFGQPLDNFSAGSLRELRTGIRTPRVDLEQLVACATTHDARLSAPAFFPALQAEPFSNLRVGIFAVVMDRNKWVQRDLPRVSAAVLNARMKAVTK